MTITGLLIFLAMGAIAGFLAGSIMRGGGFGLVGNIVVGIVGAVIGGWVFGQLGVATGGMLGQTFAATVGAVILLAVIGLIKKD